MGAISANAVLSWSDGVDGEHQGVIVARAKGHDIIDCAICGFRHAIPLPSSDALERVYRDAYYTEEKPTFLAHAGEDQEWAALAQNDRLAIFERLLPPHRRRLIDIGSGPGFFLRTAKERGWRTLGIEPSRQAAAHARGLGLEVVEGFFGPSAASGLGRFDVVHMNNVLEHVPHPMELVAAARDLLQPGGLLCLNVPNDFSPFQEGARASLGIGQWWVAPPHHLNYFDFGSLSRLVTRMGFRIEERTTSFPMEMFLLMGFDYTADPALGRACHEQRKRFDLALEQAGLAEARRAFYRALAAAGIGREAVIVAVKG